MGTDVMSGIGAGLDMARKGIGFNTKTYNMLEPQVLAYLPLAPGVALDAIRQGDLLSVLDGQCYPFREDLPFAGICHTLSQDRDKVVVAHVSRGAIEHHIDGLTADSRRGTPVYAVPGERTENLNVLGRGVAIGQVYQVTNLALSRAVLWFKATADSREFASKPTSTEVQSL
jgi:hypothetical protein